MARWCKLTESDHMVGFQNEKMRLLMTKLRVKVMEDIGLKLTLEVSRIERLNRKVSGDSDVFYILSSSADSWSN